MLTLAFVVGLLILLPLGVFFVAQRRGAARRAAQPPAASPIKARSPAASATILEPPRGGGKPLDRNMRPTINVAPGAMEELLRQKAEREPPPAPRPVPRDTDESPAPVPTAATPPAPAAAPPPPAAPEPEPVDFFKKITLNAEPPKKLLKMATPRDLRTLAVPVFATTPKGSPILPSPEDVAAARATDEVDSIPSEHPPASDGPTDPGATVAGRKPAKR